jgi:hypothetical protein
VGGSATINSEIRSWFALMARSKTSTFYIREETGVSAGATALDTLDLSLYVDPVNKQALLIKSVDFIWTDSSNYLPIAWAADAQVAVQLHDSNLGGMFSLENQHQVASGSVYYDNAGAIETGMDFFPDKLGRAKGEGRIIVNDSMEIATRGNGTVPANSIVTICLECEVVKLNEKDYIALALQTVAEN